MPQNGNLKIALWIAGALLSVLLLLSAALNAASNHRLGRIETRLDRIERIAHEDRLERQSIIERLARLEANWQAWRSPLE